MSNHFLFLFLIIVNIESPIKVNECTFFCRQLKSIMSNGKFDLPVVWILGKHKNEIIILSILKSFVIVHSVSQMSMYATNSRWPWLWKGYSM